MNKMNYCVATVVDCEDVAGNIFLLTLDIKCDDKTPLNEKIKDEQLKCVDYTDDISGKFYMLKAIPSKTLLARPISIYHAQDNKLYFLIAKKGEGTTELYNLRAGDKVELTGPLGNSFDYKSQLQNSGASDKNRKLCLISGGVGVAPISCLAEELTRQGIQFDFYASFKGKPYGLDYVKNSGTRLFIATESGEEGARGMLPVIFDSSTIERENYSAIYSCGPTPMLRYVKDIAEKAGVTCYLSLERRMACGVGVCLGCSVKTVNGIKRCCKDGPVFLASDLVLDSNEKAKNAASGNAATVGANNCVKDSGASDDNFALDMSVDIRNKKTGEIVTFINPIVASSGTFGFGTEYADIIDLSKLGGISSKGLTLEPRQGNDGVRLRETPSGLLNSIGLQNPGIPYFIEHLLPDMLLLKPITIVNLSGSTADDYIEGAKLLEKTAAKVIELNISCPNVKTGGAAFGMSCNSAKSIVSAIRGVLSKTLIVKLTPQASNLKEVAMGCVEAGADAISLCNSFSGVAIDIEKGRPVFNRVTAGFGGPAIRPIAMRLVYEVCTAMNLLPEKDRIPVFAIGGVQNWRDVVEYIMAGATIVEVGTATFAAPHSMEECVTGLRDFMIKKHYHKLSDMRGMAL